MTESGKQQYEREWQEKRAREILKDWKTADMSELSWACQIFDAGLLLLIQRMAESA
jgi:hypothetical protein